jgi:hypothetical protein
MKTLHRPGLGELVPISVGQRPCKVIKHLYNPRERWDTLIDHDVALLLAEARAAGVTATPGRDAVVDHAARSTIILQRHHDLHYGPTYLRCLAAETTPWVSQPRLGPDRAYAYSKEGVLIAFDRGERCKIVTAFRPDLPVANVQPTEHDFAMEARSRWRRAVSSSAHRDMTNDLTDALDGDRGDLASAWRLAAAVGRAAHAPSLDLGGLRERAVAALSAVDPALRRELVASLDADALLDSFADSIRDSDGTEALDGLIALEGVIAAAAALGEADLAERVVEDAAVRATCVGPEMIGLAGYAETRATETTAILARYWGEIGGEIVANAVRLAPPARSTRAVLTLPSAWLREQLEAIGAAFTELIAGASVAQPTLSSGEQDREVIVDGHARGGSAIRGFVVDRENPTGVEVSDLIRRAGDRWSFRGWRVEPDDAATLVIVVGGRSEAGPATLASLFALADDQLEFDATSLMDAR